MVADRVMEMCTRGQLHLQRREAAARCLARPKGGNSKRVLPPTAETTESTGSRIPLFSRRLLPDVPAGYLHVGRLALLFLYSDTRG